MATLELESEQVGAYTRRTLTHHETYTAGSLVKLELGEDELNEEVPAGKSWTVQATLLVTETDA